MRLVYFGTAEFAVPALRAMDPHVVLVVSQPDRPTGRGLKLLESPVKRVALELGLPVETPEKARDPAFVERIAALEADALLVAAYGQILSVKLLESARCGGVNLHGSLLPKYRGAAPIQRAIQEGETETGVTVMQMDKGMDTGDEIARAALLIGPDETAGELTPRLADLAAELALDWMPRIVGGDYIRTPQDHNDATMAPKVEKHEAELVFERDAVAEYNRFRAFTPAPGAWIASGHGPVKLVSVLRSDVELKSGEVRPAAGALHVGFRGGSLALLQLQPPGKRPMSGLDLANGWRLAPGSLWPR